MSRGATAVAAAALLLAACGQDDKPAPAGAPPGAPTPTAGAPAPGGSPAAPRDVTATAADPERGRQVYLGQCVACHNRDPGKDGAVGPAIKGSPRALVEARVLRAEYPAGYKPKRESRVMPARPDLAPSIQDLAAFLR